MIEFLYKASAYYTGAVNNTLGLRTIAKFDPGAAISITGLMRFREEISLDGTVIENFKFGLVPKVNSDRFLVGDDFLSCCAFLHEIGGNIIISGFNSAKYINPQRDNKFAVLEDILDEFFKIV